MKRVLITTVPFGEEISQPLDLLKSSGVDFVINPLDEKLSEVQLAELIPDFDAIIAIKTFFNCIFPIKFKFISLIKLFNLNLRN